MSYCPACGHDNPDGANQCANCGINLKAVGSSEQVQFEVENRAMEPVSVGSGATNEQEDDEGWGQAGGCLIWLGILVVVNIFLIGSGAGFIIY